MSAYALSLEQMNIDLKYNFTIMKCVKSDDLLTLLVW